MARAASARPQSHVTISSTRFAISLLIFLTVFILAQRHSAVAPFLLCLPPIMIDPQHEQTETQLESVNVIDQQQTGCLHENLMRNT